MAKVLLSLLTFNDMHFSLEPPVSRTASYPKDILRKLNEVMQLAGQLKVDYVGSTGDFLHRKASATNKEGYILLSMFMKSPVPVIGVLGNHDISGYNIGTRKNRPIGMIQKSNYLRLLDFNPIVKGEIKITGSSYFHKYDVSKEAYFKQESDRKYFTIAFTHGSLVLSEKGTFWGNYTNIGNLKKFNGTMHDVIINGHLHHNQHSVVVQEKRRKVHIFANGSLARNILKEDVAKRVPTVLRLSILSDYSVRYEEIKLKSAKPFEQAFVMPDSLDREDVYGQSIVDFVNSLAKKSGEFNIGHDAELIKKIVLKKGFSKKVEMKVISYLDERDCCADHN